MTFRRMENLPVLPWSYAQQVAELITQAVLPGLARQIEELARQVKELQDQRAALERRMQALRHNTRARARNARARLAADVLMPLAKEREVDPAVTHAIGNLPLEGIFPATMGAMHELTPDQLDMLAAFYEEDFTAGTLAERREKFYLFIYD